MKQFNPETETEATTDVTVAYETSDESRTATATVDSATPKIAAQEPAHMQAPAAAEYPDTPPDPVSVPDTADPEPISAAASVSAPSDSSSEPPQHSASPSDAPPAVPAEILPEASAAAPPESGNAACELAELREEITRLRTELQERIRPERFAGECEEFRTLYPDVPLSALPDEVWENVRQGIPIAAAFALAQRRKLCTLRQAEESNQRNRLRSTGAVRKEKSSYFTPEEVRAMTPEEVHENYRCILTSMQKWR